MSQESSKHIEEDLGHHAPARAGDEPFEVCCRQGDGVGQGMPGHLGLSPGGRADLGEGEPAAAPHPHWTDRPLAEPLQGALPGGREGQPPHQPQCGLRRCRRRGQPPACLLFDIFLQAALQIDRLPHNTHKLEGNRQLSLTSVEVPPLLTNS